MPIIKRLVPLVGNEVNRKLEIFDSTVPTRVLDEGKLKLEKEDIENDISRYTERLSGVDADLALIYAEKARE